MARAGLSTDPIGAGTSRHDGVEDVGDALAGLRADPQHVVGVAADDPADLLGVLLRLRRRQVDLVEHRDDVQVVLEREVEVRQRLGLDALRGVDQQQRALAGRERARDLVGEVDVAGGVDHVQDVVAAVVGRPRQPDVLRLDGDAALALDVHLVEVLRAHLPCVDDPGELQHPVGQRRLAVVDVGDDAEVPDVATSVRPDRSWARPIVRTSGTDPPDSRRGCVAPGPGAPTAIVVAERVRSGCPPARRTPARLPGSTPAARAPDQD